MEIVIRYLPVLWAGTVVTVELSSIAVAVGAGIGIVVGLLRTSAIRPARWTAALYVELFRSVPILLLLYFVYFGLPLVLGFELPAYPAAIAALSMYCGAYMAEVVRTGVQSVAIGQWDAAQALGLRYADTLRYIVVPQAVRVALPPAISVCVFTLKDSSVASLIGYLELTGSGVAIRESHFGAGTLGILVVVSGIYFTIATSLSLSAEALRRRLKV